jgi:cation transport ATPase
LNAPLNQARYCEAQAALERLSKVERIFFDKTGTLTQLPMKVREIFVDQINEHEFLRITGSVENDSEHPLAKAIVEHAKAKQVEFIKPESFKALPALGVVGQLPITNYQLPIFIGSARLDVCRRVEHVHGYQSAG